VLVAGGGPAGITAALRAAEAGFSVRLFEAGRRLGGMLNTAAAEPLKEDIRRYLEYLLGRIAASEVEVHLQTPVEGGLLQKENPEVLFDATGSRSLLPDIPADPAYLVLPVRDLLLDMDRYRPALQEGGRAVVLGGGSSGCEAALLLHRYGLQAAVIEQAAAVLGDLEPVSARSLRHLLEQTDIAIHTDTRFVRLEQGGVRTDRWEEALEADLVIAALGSRSNGELASRLGSRWRCGVNYLPIGDAHRVGKIHEAVHDSYWRTSGLLDTIG
jgi:2-enoate reductase